MTSPNPKNRLYSTACILQKLTSILKCYIYIYAWFSPRYFRCLRQIFEYSDVFIVFLGEGNKRSEFLWDEGGMSLYPWETVRSKSNRKVIVEVLAAYFTTTSLASYCWWRNPCTTWDIYVDPYLKKWKRHVSQFFHQIAAQQSANPTSRSPHGNNGIIQVIQQPLPGDPKWHLIIP